MPRNRKPAAIRKAEGNRSRTPIPEEIRPEGEPRCPDRLSGEGRQLWHGLVEASPPGLLTRADEAVLERMAFGWALFRQAAAGIEEAGVLVTGRDGSQVRNPWLIVMRQATGEMEQCSAALGLSPAARTRITAPEKANDDPLALLLGPEGSSWRTAAKKLDS